MANSTQITSNYNGCFNISDQIFLNDPMAVAEFAKKICDAFNYKIVKDMYHKFEPIGITYVAILSESHIAIHTWPEKNEMNVDIATCRNIAQEEYQRVIENLIKELQMEAKDILESVETYKI